MKEMSINEIERAIKWNLPFHAVVELVQGTGVLDWNINGLFCYSTSEEASRHFQMFKDSSKKVVLQGEVVEKGQFKFGRSKGDTVAVENGPFLIRSEQREYIEISAGLCRENGKTQFSELVVPLTDGVWG